MNYDVVPEDALHGYAQGQSASPEAVVAMAEELRYRRHWGTPAASWRLKGEPDPHGTHYAADKERSSLPYGYMTDDVLANAASFNPSMPLLTAMKERMRWLSRKVVDLTEKRHGKA